MSAPRRAPSQDDQIDDFVFEIFWRRDITNELSPKTRQLVVDFISKFWPVWSSEHSEEERKNAITIIGRSVASNIHINTIKQHVRAQLGLL